jgi:diguanylate cyclase (GGDEF)-like protein
MKYLQKHFNISKRQIAFYMITLMIVIVSMAIYALFLEDKFQAFSTNSAIDEAKRSAKQLIITRSVLSSLAPHVSVDETKVEPFAFTPFAITDKISQKMYEENGYYIKHTSQQYRNVKNRPNLYEEVMLKELEASQNKEVAKRIMFNGKDSLHYGLALRVEKSCLQCHGKPYDEVPKQLYDRLVSEYGDIAFNYKEGDLRGMVSIIIPMEKFSGEYYTLLVIMIIGALVIVGLFLVLFYVHYHYLTKPQIEMLEESKQELQTIAFLDLLTNVPNRRAFHLDIKRFTQKRQTFWLLFFDLDNFKPINDTYGHEMGDFVLKTFAKRLSSLQESLRVYRLGGDEFTAIWFDHEEVSTIEELNSAIVQQMSYPIKMGEIETHIGVSIGCVHFNKDAQDIETLLRYGDLAMYSAKEGGKNRAVVYDKALLAQADALRLLQNDLRDALANNEFFLLYQPQYDYKEKRIIGCEALLRWKHPTKGVVTPDDFMAVVEENGLIQEVGRWILFEAIRQNSAWQKMGFDPIMMSVNVSPAQLNDFSLLMDLVDVINETAISPEYIEIEFIERAAINNEGEAVAFMEELEKIQISSAIDDFGTGYSSLSYITKYPIKKIKIDKLFIQEIHQTPANQTIVRSILSIAQHLGFKVVAEGVEFEDELKFLEAEGCHIVQGYIFSKPLEASQMETLLANQTRE